MEAVRQISIHWFDHSTRESSSEESAAPPHYTADDASSAVGMFALTSSKNSLAILGFETYEGGKKNEKRRAQSEQRNTPSNYNA